MARRKEAVIHCPRAFRSPESISSVPVSRRLYQAASMARCSCQHLTWQCQPSLHWVIGIYNGMRFTRKLRSHSCGSQVFLNECTNKPRTRSSVYTDITAPLSDVLQKAVKSQVSPWSHVGASQLCGQGMQLHCV